MNDRIVIFGAGEWGEMAYYYYNTRCDIECFIDNSKLLWGTKLHGIEICTPDILNTMDLSRIKIVIANKRQNQQIQEQLFNRYGICSYIVFRLQEMIEEHVPYYDSLTVEDECIIEYEGGLGNQMFQYVLAKCFLKRGLHVTGDFSTYNNVGRRKFILTDIFPRISIPKCNLHLKKNYKNASLHIVEENILSLGKKETDFDVLNEKKGYFEGYWQSSCYVRLVEREIREDFEFIKKDDKKLNKLLNEIIEKNAVSIHVRRGDYLQANTKRIFGNICTDEYYKKAIAYIQRSVKDPVYYFFSNDIYWVRQNYIFDKAVYVSEELFEDYEDWYDMYLMSVCKHNIIANSTFSWWGAWLNHNPGKIVVAPSKWINGCDFEDIYPEGWVKV